MCDINQLIKNLNVFIYLNVIYIILKGDKHKLGLFGCPNIRAIRGGNAGWPAPFRPVPH